MLNALWKSGARKRTAQALEAALVARARAPVFYETLRVPDTLDGRFDLVVLHAWLVLSRLKESGATALSQALTDVVFTGFDEGLRELGTGDMGMARRLKAIANAFYGRLHAYDAAADETAMADALLRNLYRGVVDRAQEARVLAKYVFAARAALARADLESGIAEFGALPT